MTITDACYTVSVEMINIWKERQKSKNLIERKNLSDNIKRLHKRYYDLIKNSNRSTDVEKRKRSEFMKDVKPIWNIECKQKAKRAKLSKKDSVPVSDHHSQHSASLGSKSDPNFSPEQPARKQPKQFRMSQHLAAALDRSKVSDRDASRIIFALADACSIEPSNVNASSANIRRNRIKMRKQTAEEVRTKFVQDNSQAIFVLHWDGKRLPNTTSSETDYTQIDRLAIILSFGKEMKMLAVPKLTDGKSKTQFNAIKDTINNWGVRDCIKAICFDNTNVNTGEREGTCLKLRQELEGNILTFSCRLHMLEIVLSKVYSIAMDDDPKSPNITLFLQFKKQWETINPRIYEPCINDNIVDSAFDDDERRELLEFLQEQLLIQKPERHDYIELVQLSIMFLGGGRNIFNLRKPGAVHRARFMMRAIIALKMCLLRGQLNMPGKF